MKLPEYDNRPAAGQPLHSSTESEWEDIKFSFLGLGIPAFIVASLAVVAYALIKLLFN